MYRSVAGISRWIVIDQETESSKMDSNITDSNLAGSNVTGSSKACSCEKLRYMIIGAGGTGGAVGSYLAKAGHDVTFIARGSHLEAMRTEGLRVIRPHDEFTVHDFRAFTEDEFLEKALADDRTGKDEAAKDVKNKDGSARGAAPKAAKDSALMPDVIFVCVKGYSVDGIIPFVRQAASDGALVIPILNLFGTGKRMQEKLPGIMVTDGCIYVASEIRSPGVILMNGDILRVVFGLRREDAVRAKDYEALFARIHDDLTASGIDCIISDNIERDALRKFSYVSPQGACGLYYGAATGSMQREGEERECFAGLVHEVQLLAEAMGLDFGEDIVPANLRILDGLEPTMTTSLQRDVAAGRSSEIDGLIFDVVRLAEERGIKLPLYEKIVVELKAGQQRPL